MFKDLGKLWGKPGLFLVLPLLFWLLPTSWLERGPSICLIHRIFGVRCPACGMTRALSYLAHGKLRAAWNHNPLVILIAPLLGYIWGQTLYKALVGQNKGRSQTVIPGSPFR